ncbi:AbiJ-related protein [Streptomyces sp. NPDC004752]
MDSRFTTARGDIVQHRINDPLDLPDDWVFEDPRFQLFDGPDEVLLAFLARLVHPEVRPDVDQSSRRVEELNRLLGPDGWTFRAFEFLSGRPIYTPFPMPATGPMVSLPLADDDTGKLDLVLGHTYSLLDRDGEEVARDLLRPAVLTLRCDGGIYHPMPSDGWTVDTYEAVLTVDRALLPAFTKAVTDAIRQRLESVLTRLQREDVQSLVVEGGKGPQPAVPPDWRNQTAEPDPPVVRRLRIGPPTTEFNVALQDFSDLEIRGHGFPYFYDTRRGRLITDFLLDDRPQMATLCHVTLINKDGVLSPRIKLWKKDKTKAARTAAMEAIPGTEAPEIVKALVDTSDVHENFWQVISFLQGCVGLDLPGSSLRLVVGDEAELARFLAASALKLLHLVAFTEAVGDGRTGIRDTFLLADWDRHHLPGTDGGARLRAFEALGIRRTGEFAAEPERSIPPLQLVKAMIGFSDNSATDCLHDLLGPADIERVGIRYGWLEPDLRSLLGELLLLVAERPLPGVSPRERRAHGHELRERYFTDESFRRLVGERIPAVVSPSTYAEQAVWAVGGPAATVRDIANLMTAVVRGAVSEKGPQQMAQRYLEMQGPRMAAPGLVGIGAKGGVVPGVLSSAVNARWSDGRTGVVVAVVSGLSRANLTSAARSGSLLSLLKRALTDERWALRLVEAIEVARRDEDPVPGRWMEEGEEQR